MYQLSSEHIFPSALTANSDGVVAIGGCDKNMPGCVMGLARLNRPSVFVYGGTIQPGANHTDIVSVFEAVGKRANNDINDIELEQIESKAIPGPGSCGGMYTANTMASAIEALGMSLPNSSAQDAISDDKNNDCSRAGEAVLNLLEKDHCLNIMPLFHIHGLIAIIASSMKSGASVCASSGFNALKFLELAKSEKITWYSGVPTMHQTIMLRAEKNLELAKNLNLRLVRSSSASLPPAVFEKLNKVFNCPVIEAYGMTEATHQMTSNPLPPKKQKAGFVGIPAGPEVAIMDNNNNIMKNGEVGEICIKGNNVTAGYENNPEANKANFNNGWFRTGDQGFFDNDGYLKISGRLKEIINKGGEKISPLEVDNVLMDHPLIEQAVCFGYEDKMLGEDIATAIILKEGVNLDEAGLKVYAKEKLAKFKIPKKIFFVTEIPKGATGKLQRNVLAKKFGLNN